MRQVVLDTETTGLDVEHGHRIIEIGCVELVNRRPTQATFHHYVQPDRDIDPGAMEVHGITPQKLAGKPRFKEIAEAFIAFVDGSELIIHNAGFDLGFLRRELVLSGYDAELLGQRCQVTDTLALARRLHPGQRNSLDALCKRYAIDNTGREYHGALLDAGLLADVYLAMTGGQATLSLDMAASDSRRNDAAPGQLDRAGLSLRVVEISAAEIEAHGKYLDQLDEQSRGQTVWRRGPSPQGLAPARKRKET